MQNYYAIGKLRQVKQKSFKNGTTGEVRSNAELTIEFVAVDINGEETFDMDKLTIDLARFGEFHAKIGKFIGVPYRYFTSKDKSFMFPDTDLPIITFDFNPLVDSPAKAPAK